MHIVHRHKHSQQLGAVVAILFDKSLGSENRLLEKLYPFIMSEESEQEVALPINSFLSEVDFSRFVHY